MLLLLISISLASIYGFDYDNQSPDTYGIYAQNSNNDNTVQLSCLDIALVLYFSTQTFQNRKA